MSCTMGCLLSRLYDKSLRTRGSRKRALKYRLDDEEVETKTLSPSSTTVPNYSASSTTEAAPSKAVSKAKPEAPKKEYSWDKRRKLDPKDFALRPASKHDLCSYLHPRHDAAGRARRMRLAERRARILVIREERANRSISTLAGPSLPSS